MLIISYPNIGLKRHIIILSKYVNPQLYKEFYVSYKEELFKKSYNKWSDFSVKINKSIISDINNFISMNKNARNHSGFRLFKNHILIDLSKKDNNNAIHNSQINDEQRIIENENNKIVSANKNVNINIIKKINNK